MRKFNVIALAVVSINLLSCALFAQKAKNEEIKKSIEKQLIGERILELGDLDSGTKNTF